MGREAARVMGSVRDARAAGIAVAIPLLSIGPLNAIREATSNDMFVNSVWFRGGRRMLVELYLVRYASRLGF